ncbi:MAG: 8-oxo-dGTP diphosphatase [Polaribacter sp.]
MYSTYLLLNHRRLVAHMMKLLIIFTLIIKQNEYNCMARAKLTIVVRMFLQQKSKVLLLKQTAKNGGNYTMVGGKIDQNEMAVTALIRESYEEVGVSIQEKHLKLVHVVNRARPSSNELILVFRAKKWMGEPKSMEKEKFESIGWFDPVDLPKETLALYKHVLKHYAKRKHYSEYFDADA